jgi:hypothetical protein
MKKSQDEETIQTTDAGEAEPSQSDDLSVDEESPSIPEEDVQEPEKPVLARDKMMEELAQKRRDELRERREESVNPPVEEVKPEPEEDSDSEFVNLKVNGKDVRKTKAEVDAAGGQAQLQKSLSVEEKLKEAAKKRRELEEKEEKQLARERELAEREKRLNDRLAEVEERLSAEKEAAPVLTAADIDSAARRFISNVYSGKEDEAISDLKEVLTSAQPKAVQKDLDVSKIVEESTARATFEAERNLGKRDLKKNFPHLMKDQNLFAMTNRETARLLDAHPEWSPYDIIMTAAQNIDEWAKGVVGETAPVEETDVVEERIEKKRSNQVIPTAKGRMQTQSGYKPKTKEQIMAEYRQQRAR